MAEEGAGATAPDTPMMLARLARKAVRIWNGLKGAGAPGPVAPMKPETGVGAGRASMPTDPPEKRNRRTGAGATPAAGAEPRAAYG
jgi:hypothetical protein